MLRDISPKLHGVPRTSQWSISVVGLVARSECSAAGDEPPPYIERWELAVGALIVGERARREALRALGFGGIVPFRAARVVHLRRRVRWVALGVLPLEGPWAQDALGALALGDAVPLRAVGVLDLGELDPDDAVGALALRDTGPFRAVGALDVGGTRRVGALGALAVGQRLPSRAVGVVRSR